LPDFERDHQRLLDAALGHELLRPGNPLPRRPANRELQPHPLSAQHRVTGDRAVVIAHAAVRDTTEADVGALRVPPDDMPDTLPSISRRKR
jgi:hypothetical protein